MESQVKKVLLSALILVSGFLTFASALVVPVFTHTAAEAASNPVMVAAGDIACDPADPDFAGTNPADCQMRATANEIASIAPQYLAPLGDEQYYNGGSDPEQGEQPPLSAYQGSYNATWGAISTRVPGITIRSVPGNHEYGDGVTGEECDCEANGTLSNGSNYYTNMGANGLNEIPSTVTGPSNDWYSYDIPVSGSTWHVIALDSECAVLPAVTGGGPSGNASGCGAGSPEETWFRNDLAAHQDECDLVYMHEPRWASGDTGNDTDYTQLWDDAVAGHVTAVLAGHDHLYERFSPMDDNGNPSASGTAEFIVGTGGRDLEQGNTSSPALAASDFNDFGVLKMTLQATSMTYAFQTVSGTTPDSGTLACNLSQTPTVASVSPSSGPAGGGTQVTITGTNFTGVTAVQFGSAAASSFTVNSTSSITATAPSGSGTVNVEVTGSGGTSAPTANDDFTYSGTTSYALVQQGAQILSGNASSAVVTLGSAAKAGDLLVATGDVYPGAASGVTGPSGFTLAGSSPGSGSSGTYVWYKVAAGGETSFSFAQSASANNYSAFAVTEISGGFSSVSLDGTPSFQSSLTAGTGYTQTYGSTPSASGDLAFAFFVTGNATAQSTPAGWTLIGTPSNTNDNSGSYFMAAGTSAPTITTAGLSPSGGYSAGMVLFKKGAGSSPTVPGSPTAVTATAANASANVSWTAPTSNGGSALTGYTVTASPGGATTTVGGSTTSATVSGLTNGQSYTFSVVATNVAGHSVASSPSNAVTPTAGTTSYALVQQGAQILSGNASSAVVTLGSAAKAGDLLVATGDVYPGAASGVTGPSGFTLAGSSPGSGSSGTYVWYKVAAGGETSFSFAQSASANNYSAFAVTEISGGFSSVSLDGTPSFQSSLTAGTGYTQTYGSTPSASGDLAFAFFVTGNATAQSTPAGWTLIGTPSNTNDNSGSYFMAAGTSAPTITTAGLSPSGGYSAGMVLFKKGAGSSPTVPGSPTAVTATAANASANVSWTAPTSNGGSALTGYTVTASPGGATTTVGGSTTSATVSGLTNGQSYTFSVVATNVAGHSVASSPSNAVTPTAGTTSYALVQQGAQILSGNASSAVVTLGSAAKAGDLLVATGDVYPGAASGVTGPSGFTLAGSSPGSGSSGTYVWYKVAAGGETSFSFAQSASANNYSAFAVTEISGGFSSVSLDGTPSFQSSLTAGTGYTQTYGSTPSASGDLAFAFFVTGNATAQSTPAGWTLIGTPSNTNDNSGSYFMAAGTSAPTITTAGLSPSGGYSAGMVLFKT